MLCQNSYGKWWFIDYSGFSHWKWPFSDGNGQWVLSNHPRYPSYPGYPGHLWSIWSIRKLGYIYLNGNMYTIFFHAILGSWDGCFWRVFRCWSWLIYNRGLRCRSKETTADQHGRAVLRDVLQGANIPSGKHPLSYWNITISIGKTLTISMARSPF